MKKIFLIPSLAIVIISPWSFAQTLHPSSSIGGTSSTPGSASQKNIGQTPLPNKQSNVAGTNAPVATQKNEGLASHNPAPYSTPKSSSATSTAQQSQSSGKGSLLEANLEEESTKAKALVEQQEIAIKSMPVQESYR